MNRRSFFASIAALPCVARLIGNPAVKASDVDPVADFKSAWETGWAKSGVHYYNIDARGVDPILVESRIRRAILAAHSRA